VALSAPIIVLAPLRGGEEDAARAAIAALDDPFARIPGTHLARVQVLRPPARRFRGRTRHYLLLAADHDGPAARWLVAAARELEPVLAHCAFWPGAGDREAVVHWARARELDAGFSIVGAPRATVEEVGEALHLRERLARFAAQTEGLDDAALHASWTAR
jgi:hypothetical protein